MKQTLYTALAALLLAAPAVQAQETAASPLTFGAYGGINLNFHSPSFKVPGTNQFNGIFNGGNVVNDSATFSSGGTGFAFHLGGMVNYALSKRIVLTGRIGYYGLGGSFSTSGRETGGLVADTTVSTHNFDVSLGMLEIMPAARFENLFEGQPIYLLGGLEFAFPLSTGITHTETATAGKTFQNPTGATTRTYAGSGTVPDASMRAALALGAGYTFTLPSGMKLSPEISYRAPLTNVSSTLNSWSVPQLRIGLTLEFGSSTPNVESKRQSGSLNVGMESIGYYDKAGNYVSMSGSALRVEDVQYSEMYPLVPYVFFQPAASRPADSVQTMFAGDARGQFMLSALPQDAVEINKRTLDIIGTRMKENSNTRITITGTNDGRTETKNKQLSQQRAEFARNYLMQAHGIDGERITVQARDLPERPSAQNIPEGQAENRRIEFKSSTPDLLEPIVIRGDEQRVAAPEMLEFRPSVQEGASITSWSLTLLQAGRTLREYVGMGLPPPQRWVIRPNELSNAQVPIEYTFTAVNSDGAKGEVNGSIPVEYISSTRKRTEQLADRTIAKFSLILFDFDKADVPEENVRILEKYVVPAIRGNSTVKIYGYTDKTGPAEYNRKLSQDRANAVKKILEGKVQDARYEAFGRGEDVPIFDNENTTGRQLSRTVQIYVETPR